MSTPFKNKQTRKCPYKGCVYDCVCIQKNTWTVPNSFKSTENSGKFKVHKQINVTLKINKWLKSTIHTFSSFILKIRLVLAFSTGTCPPPPKNKKGGNGYACAADMF